MRYLNDRFAWAVPTAPALGLGVKSNFTSDSNHKGKEEKLPKKGLINDTAQLVPSDDDLIDAIINENHNLFKRLAQ